MAESFAAKGEMLAAHAAQGVVVMSKPVRQGVLHDCLTQLHTNGVYRKEGASSVAETDEFRARCQPARAAIQPVAEGAERQSESTVSRGCHPKPWTSRRTSPHVLLVEDNSTSQEAMRRIILDAGMLCDVAGNGKEALVAIERASFDLVLMDFLMPVMDGSTATKLLREREAELSLHHLPVIGISATLGDERACLAAGMDGIIQKPCREAELLTIVDTFLKPNGDEKQSALKDASNVVSKNVEIEAPAFNVLVAEDSAANQMAIKRMLSKHGAMVTVVADGHEAVDLIVKKGMRYNLAFFDINMPLMGGIEAMHCIRSLQIDMPIIAITASIEVGQLTQYLGEGFSMVTTKPLRVAQCCEILTKYGHNLPLDPGKRGPAANAQGTSSSSMVSTRGEETSARYAVSSALDKSGIRNIDPAGGDKGKKQIRVLVVEDNCTSQTIMQRILEREGLDVSFAVNGDEAVEKAQETPYDAILMDCDMPLKDGWQATREIRKWEMACGSHGGKRVPIIAVTANAMRGDRERCLEQGMDDYLSKPVQRMSLLQMIRCWICQQVQCPPDAFVPAGRMHESERSVQLGAPAAVQTAVAPDAVPTALAAHTAPAPISTSSPSPTGSNLSSPRSFAGTDSWTKENQPCVLVVMHNTAERLLLKHMCGLEGCGVHTCDTGLKAMQLLEANVGRYTLCLIDTVLPDVEPHSLCSRMSELVRGQAAGREGAPFCHVPLVLIGTSVFAPSRAMVLEIGCEDLFMKPVTRSMLCKLLARIKNDSTPKTIPLKAPPHHLTGYHLLYAEDSLPSQKIVKRLLEKAGSKCTVVDNGKLAVEAALENPTMFDCILMDCNMPEMDGWEATQQIKKVLGHRVPIIAVTANALKGDREKCLEAGMDDYITKPVKLSLLLDVVLRWIALSRTKSGYKESIHATDDTGGGNVSSDVADLRWSSFSTYDLVEGSPSLPLRRRLLTVAPPSKQPVDVLTLLEQVDGDWDFMMDMVEQLSTTAKAQLASCSLAAQACDTVTLNFEAHSLKGVAATCYATQLASSCGALERMARRERHFTPTEIDTNADCAPSESPEYWKDMVDDVAEYLDAFSCNVHALGMMRMLPSFSTLTDACGDDNDDIVGALSDLLGASVDAYVAAHAAIYESDISEASFGFAREQLKVASVAANALSVEDLVRTTRLLSEHFANPPPAEETLGNEHRSVLRSQIEDRLDDMRIIVESLASETAMLLGDRMPVLDILFADDAAARHSVMQTSSVRVGGTICDYSAIMQNAGDDHNLVAALLSSFKDSLSIFCDGVAENKYSLFDAQSLHGAAVSMCAPRVVAAVSNFIVATKAEQKDVHAAGFTHLSNADAVANAISDLRAAVCELTSFQGTLQRV
uniref:Histidine kinase n=1 Tax=Mantoniella antarctica TaxID=81844 RepID=A0A7S0S9T0_9CHLO